MMDTHCAINGTGRAFGRQKGDVADKYKTFIGVALFSYRYVYGGIYEVEPSQLNKTNIKARSQIRTD
jgi:hypothetical protein